MNDLARENDKQSGNINKAIGYSIAKCSSILTWRQTRYKLYQHKNFHTAQILVA